MGRVEATAAGRDLRALFESGAIGGLGDEELLVRFAANREEAVFDAIVRRHGPMVWGVCRRVLRDHHAAEDAFQVTFLVLARRAGSVRRPGQLAQWLHGGARQTARKARSIALKRVGRERPIGESLGAVPAGSTSDPAGDLLPLLDQELGRLPDKYRDPVILCELEGLTHREAADRLGGPVGTVAGRLSRARGLLAERLARRGVAIAVGLWAVGEAGAAGWDPRLARVTARAATRVESGRSIAAGTVSAGVAALEWEVSTMLWVSKGKTIAALGLALAVTGGVGRFALMSLPRASADDGPVATVAKPAPPPVKVATKEADDARARTEFESWIYRAATPADVRHSAYTVGGKAVSRASTGEYFTEESFDAVVRFYVERSGFKPDNWDILGQKFVGDSFPKVDRSTPSSWSVLDKSRVLTITHHLRPDIAVAVLSLSDFVLGETVSVTITRGKGFAGMKYEDNGTTIRIVRQTSK